jgi:transcription initiation factor IIF auxiliary subunit
MPDVNIIVKNTSKEADVDSETGTQFYDWSIYIQTDPRPFLASIKEVIYYLHPTFPEPEVRVQNTTPNFKLDSKGWGEFIVNIDIIRNDNKKARIDHILSLSTEGGKSRHPLKDEHFK